MPSATSWATEQTGEDSKSIVWPCKLIGPGSFCLSAHGAYTIRRVEQERGRPPRRQSSLELGSRESSPEDMSPDRDLISASQHSPVRPETQETQDGNPFTIDHNPNGSHFFLPPNTNSFTLPHEVILGGNSYSEFIGPNSWGNNNDFYSTGRGHSSQELLTHWDDHGRSLPSTQTFLNVSHLGILQHTGLV